MLFRSPAQLRNFPLGPWEHNDFFHSIDFFISSAVGLIIGKLILFFLFFLFWNILLFFHIYNLNIIVHLGFGASTLIFASLLGTYIWIPSTIPELIIKAELVAMILDWNFWSLYKCNADGESCKCVAILSHNVPKVMFFSTSIRDRPNFIYQ